MASGLNCKRGSVPSISLSDCMCPICLSILIEPVTMPCGHELCMPCFKLNVQETSLTCPMCRKRISTWARQGARNKTLVNQRRWRDIQLAFPEKVKHRLEGDEEDDSMEDGTCLVTWAWLHGADLCVTAWYCSTANCQCHSSSSDLAGDCHCVLLSG